MSSSTITVHESTTWRYNRAHYVIYFILKGLNNKTKLTIYKTFGGEVKFKLYLNGVGDAGTRLLFKLRSGMHGFNEEVGRHRGREGVYV